MAYTQDQINAAYTDAKSKGMSDADIWDSGAKNFGVTQDQFNLASQAWGSTPDQGSYGSGTPAYTPAPASAPAAAAPVASGWEGGRDLTADEIAAARNWSVGKTSQEAAAQASGMGLTQKQLGQVYKWSAEDSALGGYGTEAGLDKDRYDYTYDAEKGWIQESKKPPKTGINLSQLQGVTKWEVSPNETVRSQLQQIIADDSPLMQQARARAMQTSNARGLLNSSMAATAGESALYDAAMPIATQDAATYARSGEFNAGQANTFSRDNNQFVRDAYMADFNVQANEWAAQQQWDRDYKTLDRQQQLQLERDAIQNGYQSARDKFAADQQAMRDDKDIAARLQLGQMDAASRAASFQPDTSMARAQLQLDADERKTQQQIAADDRSTLTNMRSDYAAKVFQINTSEMSPEKADRAISDLAATYNPQLTEYAKRLGYNPDSWIIKTEPKAAPAPAPAPAAAPIPNGDAGG
jgi:hypothetical protein